MIVAVADTHAPIWYGDDDPRLSKAAVSWIEQAERRGDRIALSTISLVEIVYLIEKGRVAADTLDQVLRMMGRGKVFLEIPVTRAIIAAMALVPRHEVPDMPDRVIAATAVHLGVPLISRDGKIRASSVTTIW
jgi:PIN domain nuclease of toxin-antitoxin system